MTKKQKQAYLKKPNHCPYCNSKNISSDTIQADGKEAYSNVGCSDCKKLWTDIYTLTHIEEVVAP